MSTNEDEAHLDYFSSLWKGLGRIMPTTEDETRLIRVVFDVRNINILLRFWHDVEVEALKVNDPEKALIALAYIKTLQEARSAHGIEPLELDEEGEPIKAEAASTNGQPDEGDV